MEEKLPPLMLSVTDTCKYTGLSERFVRRLLHENKIVFVKSGNRALINVDRLIDYLNTGDGQKGGGADE